VGRAADQLGDDLCQGIEDRPRGLSRSDLRIGLAEAVAQFGDGSIEIMRQLIALTPQEFVSTLCRKGLQPPLPSTPYGHSARPPTQPLGPPSPRAPGALLSAGIPAGYKRGGCFQPGPPRPPGIPPPPRGAPGAAAVPALVGAPKAIVAGRAIRLGRSLFGAR